MTRLTRWCGRGGQRREGVYIDVVGTWKKVKDQGFCVVSQACTLVRDFNQVTHHYLDALYVHLYNTKGPLTVRCRALC